jgi:hypothetical protein
MSQIIQPYGKIFLYYYGLCAIIPVSGLEQAPGKPRAGPSANVEKAACSEPCAGHASYFKLSCVILAFIVLRDYYIACLTTRDFFWFWLLFSFTLSMSSFWQVMLPRMIWGLHLRQVWSPVVYYVSYIISTFIPKGFRTMSMTCLDGPEIWLS